MKATTGFILGIRSGTVLLNGIVCIWLSLCLSYVTSQSLTPNSAIVKVDKNASTTDDSSCMVCPQPIPYDGSRHEPLYRVGVLAPGADVHAAYEEHNQTFSYYLTATAGKRFNPPIRFEMVPVHFEKVLFDAAEAQMLDFLYLSPSAFSCIESEFGAQSLVTQISRRTTVGGDEYDLPMVAGVIAVRANNDNIQTIQDLKDKIIAATSMSSFDGAQVQFREMQQAGMSYINDPKQLIFTNDPAKTVNGIINGEFDVGFIRSDQIQQTRDEEGNPVNASLLKIIQPMSDLRVDGGAPYPFDASTPLYPEWNLAVLNHVSAEVAHEVQTAMYDLSDHGEVGVAIESCQAFYGTEVCDTFPFPQDFTKNPKCGITRELCVNARKAMVKGGYAGFRSTLSYMDVRSMQQDISFVSQDENTKTNHWRCSRSSNVQEQITCPSGYIKRSKELIENGCADAGLSCKEGYQCICNPCTRAFDVDVYPIHFANVDVSNIPCRRLSRCGSLEQTETSTFHIFDNKKRTSPNIRVSIFEGDGVRTFPAQQASEQLLSGHSSLSSEEAEFLYEFNVTLTQVGTSIMQIFVDDVEIDESPFRIHVLKRTCDSEHREPDSDGNCICTANTYTIGDGKCVPQGHVVLSVFVMLIVIFGVCSVYFYLAMSKKTASDSKRRSSNKNDSKRDSKRKENLSVDPEASSDTTATKDTAADEMYQQSSLSSVVSKNPVSYHDAESPPTMQAPPPLSQVALAPPSSTLAPPPRPPPTGALAPEASLRLFDNTGNSARGFNESISPLQFLPVQYFQSGISDDNEESFSTPLRGLSSNDSDAVQTPSKPPDGPQEPASPTKRRDPKQMKKKRDRRERKKSNKSDANGDTKMQNNSDTYDSLPFNDVDDDEETGPPARGNTTEF